MSTAAVRISSTCLTTSNGLELGELSPSPAGICTLGAAYRAPPPFTWSCDNRTQEWANTENSRIVSSLIGLFAGLAVHRFTYEVCVTVVACVFLNHVTKDPAKARCSTIGPFFKRKLVHSSLAQGLIDHGVGFVH